jgi:ribosome-associated protein
LTVAETDSVIRITRSVAIDERELAFDFMRASGPGGQNVNKVSTAVRLRFDARGSKSLPAEVRERLCRLAGKRIGADGFLTLLARSGRTQETNRRDAVARLVTLVKGACAKPRPRLATKPTAAAREKRLLAKKRRSTKKGMRRAQEGRDDSLE